MLHYKAMDLTTEQLARYVIQELSRGVPEQSLRAKLIQYGWTEAWIEAAFQYAKEQQDQGYSLPQPDRSDQPAVGQPSDSRRLTASPRNSRRFLKLLIIILLAFSLLSGVALVLVPALKRPAMERSARDTTRQNDVAQFLGSLSDFYETQNRYPTRDELNDPAFRAQSGFKSESIQDPQWSPSVAACTKEGHAILNDSIEARCYAYKASASSGLPCNNTDTPCTRVTITTLLEKNHTASRVTFDRNNEIEE
jgi:hypothetical protein